jgi:thiol:disulfide interchange protein DsbD
MTPLLLAAALLGLQDAPTVKKKAEVKVLAVRPEKTDVKVGEVFKVTFELEPTKGWYIYPTYPTGSGKPTRFGFEGADVAGKIEEPKAKTKPAEDPLPAYDYHEGTLTMTVPVALKPGPKPGPFTVKGQVLYQICKVVCLDGSTPFSFDLTVLEGEVQPPPPPAAAPSQDSKDAARKAAEKEFTKRGTFGFILFAMGGGLISLVMPCVYPLIPITLTYFVKQGAGSRAKGLALSSAYAVGIIVVFTGIGFLFSLLLGEDGPRIFAANPWVNVVVGAMFLWFTFSLFGLYDISLPSWMVGSAGARRSGLGGAFILGALFSVVTFTCTIPIAATVLAFSASSAAGSKFIGFFAMLAYSATMALPFFFLGMFPGLLKEVPKSGGWLHTVKVTAGFGELALAFYYLAKADFVWDLGLLTRDVMTAIWIATLAFMALYLLRVFKMPGDDEPAPAEPGQPAPRPAVGITRLLFALLFVTVAVQFGALYAGRYPGNLALVLPPEKAGAEANGPRGREKQPVFATLPAAMEEARKTGKPTFVEFTGVT